MVAALGDVPEHRAANGQQHEVQIDTLPQRRGARRKFRARHGHGGAGGLAPSWHDEGRAGQREAQHGSQRKPRRGQPQVSDLPGQARHHGGQAQAQQHAGAAQHGGLPPGQAHERGHRRTADTQQPLFAAPPVGARSGDGQRHQQRQHHAGRAQKQEQHARIQRIGAHAVQACRQIVGDGGTAGQAHREVVGQPLRLHKRGAGVGRQQGPVQAQVQLGAHGVGPRTALGVEDCVPLRNGHQQHVVGRCLRGGALGHADRLEHRIGIRQGHNTGNAHVHRRDADALHTHRVAHRDMQIGGGLGGDEHAVGAAEHETDLVAQPGGVVGVEAQHLARASALGGAAGEGAQACRVGIGHAAHHGWRGSFLEDGADAGGVGVGCQQHLPVHRQIGHRAVRHGLRRRRDKGAQCGQQCHRQRQAGNAAGEPAGAADDGASKPKGDHAVISWLVTVS